MKKVLKISALCFLLLIFSSPISAATTIKVGVLEKETLSGWDYDWKATIETLNREIPGHSFQMVELSWLELKEAIAKKEVHFAISSPIFVVEVGYEGKLSILATLKRESEKLRGYEELYGSVVFWRSDSTAIKNIWDMKNKKVAAGSVLSVGGWLAVAREFAERNIDLKKYCSGISHFYDNEKVVEEVLSRRVDFGICRTSTLETMAEEGRLKLKDISIGHELISHSKKFPFACSTRLYPEWSFARVLANTSDSVSQEIAMALLRMTDETRSKQTSWGIPANYSQVHMLMKTLKMDPFDSESSMLQSAIKVFRQWLTLFSLAVLILGITIFFLLRLNFELKKVSTELSEQKAFLKHLIDSIPDWIFVKNQSGKFLLCNHAFSEAFGAETGKLTGQTEDQIFPNGSPFLEGDDRINTNGRSIKFTKKIALADQETIYGEIIKVSCELTNDGEKIIVGIVRDVSANYKARQVQRQRERLITGIAEATHRIIGAEKTLEASMPEALNSIAMTVGAERIGLVKRGDPTDGNVQKFACFSCFHGASECKEGTPELVGRIIHDNIERFSSGQIMGRTAYEFSTSVRGELKKSGVNSLLIIPIFVHRGFWGCMEVHSIEPEREWHEFELAALELAAEMFGSMIERGQDFTRLIDYRDRLRLALDSAGLFLWEYDFLNTVNKTPDDLYQNLGYIEEKHIEEARNLGFYIIQNEDQHLIKNIGQNEICKFEVRLCAQNGRYVWHSFIGRNYFDSSHRHLKLIGFFRNTSSEHEREMALRMEESRNIHALTAASAASWEFVPEEGRFYWSSHVKNLLGYNPEIFSPNIESVFQVIHPDDLPSAKSAVRKFLITGKELRFDCRLRKIDGTHSWFANIGTQVKDPELDNVRYYGIMIDISENRILQQDLLEATSHAEKLAYQAQMANQAKTEFLANMSHEIRTPMNGILGMLELLLSTELSIRQKEFANLIYRSSHSLMGILNAILDLSKIESGKLTLEPQNINLRKIAEEVVNLMEPLADKRKNELILRYPQDAPEYVVADGGRIRQILTNLVNNAVKFTEGGFVSLEVSAEKRAEDSGEVNFTFSIKDTGIGMTDQQQTLVFEKFNQADASITRRFGGTGLGLTICKELVDLMGGRIQLESAPGVGTRMWFSLSLQMLSNYDEAKRRFEQELLIIVAGDNEPIQDTICEIISSWTVSYEKVNLEKLSDSLNKERKNKTIAIINFPPGSEEFVLPEFHPQPNHAGLIFLMTPKQLTSSSFHESKNQNTAIIGKPVTNSKLYEAIRELLKGTESRINEYFTQKSLEPEFKKHRPTEKFALQVLIVEDNEINQEVAKGIFELFGCHSEIASSGKEALKIIESHKFDAVFLDCQMPEMDGFEVVRRIRGHSSSKIASIPVIAMTAHSMTSDRKKCLDAGMDNYLSKPINPDLLARILEKLAHGKTLSEETFEDFQAEAEILTPEIDRERIKRIFSGKAGTLSKILKACKENVQNQLNKADSAIENQNFAEAIKAFHTIKGSVGNLGGIKVAEIAQRMETAARKEEIQKIENMRPDFLQAFLDFLEELSMILEELK